MEKYEKLKLDIVTFAAEDVILTSESKSGEDWEMGEL